MASEIRVLEDQLYDADYQNRVLRDRLERAGAHTHSNRESWGNSHDPDCCAPLVESSPRPVPPSSAMDGTPRIPQPPPLVESHTYDLPPDEDPNAVIEGGLLGPSISNPQADSTQPDSTNPDSTQSDASGAASPPPAINSSQTPLTDPPVIIPTPDPDTSPPPDGDASAPANPSATESTRPEGDGSDGAGTTSELPAPPSNPEPPGPETLGFPPEIPGEMIPPGPAEPDPPGRIRVPDEAKILRQAPIAPSLPPDTLPVPDHLEVHPQLSGGHQLDDDDEVDGMFLVINVLDESDEVVDLTKFDVDASMSVVAIDPKLKESDQRIARWDFDPDEVREMVRRKPVDGLHISMAWQDAVPSTDDVIVHIRLKAAEQEMRCQAKLSLKKSVAMSNWLPRAGDLR